MLRAIIQHIPIFLKYELLSNIHSHELKIYPWILRKFQNLAFSYK